LSRSASARPRHHFDDELVLDGRRCAQPPRPPRPSLSICCHHADDPKAAAWALDVSAEIAIHVAIRHNATFLMTCLILLSRCSGNVLSGVASALRRSPDIFRRQLFRLLSGGRPHGGGQPLNCRGLQSELQMSTGAQRRASSPRPSDAREIGSGQGSACGPTWL